MYYHHTISRRSVQGKIDTSVTPNALIGIANMKDMLL